MRFNLLQTNMIESKGGSRPPETMKRIPFAPMGAIPPKAVTNRFPQV